MRWILREARFDAQGWLMPGPLNTPRGAAFRAVG